MPYQNGIQTKRALLPALPDHLAKMSLFVLNTGARDEVVCNLTGEDQVGTEPLEHQPGKPEAGSSGGTSHAKVTQPKKNGLALVALTR